MQSFADNIKQDNKTQSSNLEQDHLAVNRPIWQIIVELGEQIPDEEWDQVPPDASMNYRQYLYGINKKTP